MRSRYRDYSNNIIALGFLGLAYVCMAALALAALLSAIYVIGAVLNILFVLAFGATITTTSIMLCGMSFAFFFAVSKW